MHMLSLILAVGGVPTGPFGLVAACPAVLSASRPANSTLDVLDVQSDGAGWILNTSSVLCALAHRLPGVVAMLLAVLIIIITLLVGDWRRPVFNGGNDSPTLSAGLRDRLRRCAAMQIWEELSTPTGIIRAVATLVVPTIWKPIVLSFMLVSLYIPILRCFKDPAVGWAAAPAAVPIGRTVSEPRVMELRRRGGRGGRGRERWQAFPFDPPAEEPKMAVASPVRPWLSELEESRITSFI